mgnify:CR=1 FL=1
MKRLLAFIIIALGGLASGCSTNESNFILWQLPSEGNSYIFQTKDGKVAVIDGGLKREADYVRGFLGALGNEIEAWFISHPHNDHMGVLNEILKEPGDIRIKTVYHSEFSEAFYEKYEADYKEETREFYDNLRKSGVNVVDVAQPGQTILIDRTAFKILSIKDESLVKEAPYNNSSMVIRVWDDKKSMVFLGDMEVKGGERLLSGPYRDDLNCDFLQLAHHGHDGVALDFYKQVKFNACLWASPLWMYNNDIGEGYNTYNLNTIQMRNLMDSLGITRHYISGHGLSKIE